MGLVSPTESSPSTSIRLFYICTVTDLLLMESPNAVGRQEYGLTLAASANYSCLMFVWFSLPAYLSTIIDDVSLTNSLAGIFAGAIPLTYIALALFSELVVDHLGSGRIIATVDGC